MPAEDFNKATNFTRRGARRIVGATRKVERMGPDARGTPARSDNDRRKPFLFARLDEELTGGDAECKRWAWSEVVRTDECEWVVVAGGRGGTTSTNSALEMVPGAAGLAVGDIVPILRAKIRTGDGETETFGYETCWVIVAGGGGGDSTRLFKVDSATAPGCYVGAELAGETTLDGTTPLEVPPAGMTLGANDTILFNLQEAGKGTNEIPDFSYVLGWLDGTTIATGTYAGYRRAWLTKTFFWTGNLYDVFQVVAAPDRYGMARGRLS